MSLDLNPYEAVSTTVEVTSNAVEPEKSSLRFWIGLWICESTAKLSFIAFWALNGANPTNGLIRMYDNSNVFAFFAGSWFLTIETIGPVVGVIICVKALRSNSDEFTALKRVLMIAGLSALFATLALMTTLEFLVPIF